MQFRGVIKDAKLSKTGLIIRVLGGDDCSTDELRLYLDEPVMVSVDIIAADAEVVVGEQLEFNEAE